LLKRNKNAILHKLRSKIKRYKSKYSGFYELIVKSDPIELARHISADPNLIRARDEYGQTLLFTAACWGKLDVVKYLIKQGASVNLLNQDGRSPLSVAAHFGHIDIVRFLIKRGAQINSKSRDGHTPLLSSINYGGPDNRLEVVKTLIRSGARLNDQDRLGWTPFIRALMVSDTRAALLLARLGANIKINDKNGLSAREHIESKLREISKTTYRDLCSLLRIVKRKEKSQR
jgi:ankyrin repeat protein